MLKVIARNFIRTAPKALTRMALSLAFILAVNLVLMTAKPATLPAPLGTVVSLLAFVFAAYTGIVSKAIFWTLLLTFGRSLVHRIRQEGLSKVRSELSSLPPAIHGAWTLLADRALFIFLSGGGAGLVLCNFLTKTNKINKYSPAIVVIMALLSGLGAGRESSLFVLARAVAKDLGRLLGRPLPVRDADVCVGGVGVVAGLLLDGVIVLVISSNYAGYLLGLALIAAAAIVGATKTEKQAMSA